MWFLVTISCLVWGPDDQETRQSAREVARQVTEFRGARADAKRRIEIALELAGLGDDAVQRLKESIEIELDAMELQFRPGSDDSPVLAEIERHRQLLAALRENPQLSSSIIRRRAPPALEEIKQLMALHVRQQQTRASSIRQMRPFVTSLERTLEALEEHWKDSEPPMPLAMFRERLATMTRENEPFEHAERIAEVEEINAGYERQMADSVYRGIEAVNRLRILSGLAPLEIDPQLCLAAAGHSDDMRRLRFFSHTSPVDGKRTYQDRARLAGTTASGENLHSNAPTGLHAVDAWYQSPGHHRNIMGDARRIGLGRSGNHWTLLVGP